MERLVRAFNEAIFSSGGVRTDGHLIGVVKGFDLIRSMAQSPSAYGLTNATLAACAATGRSIDTVTTPAIAAAADLKYCNDATLVTGATAYTYLWAYDTWLGPRGHEILAGSAFARADNDTF
jgi:phospholipase/lecithinase/hemolysin